MRRCVTASTARTVKGPLRRKILWMRWSKNSQSTSTIPAQESKVYPYNKPWITKITVNIMKQRQQAFKEGNTEELKALKKKARSRILQNKKFCDKV